MNDKYAMTYGTLEIFTYPDGTSETLNFPEAQKKYGDLLERADMQVKERFASCLTHFKARNNIGRNGFELQKLLATIKTIRIYTDHNEYTEGVITFGEAQERFGMDLELLTTEQRQKFAKELVKYHELTGPKKKELDLGDITPIKPPQTPNIYAITCTRVRIPEIATADGCKAVDAPMEFISTEVYEGKYYTSLSSVLTELEKMYNADSDLEKRRPDFFHVKKLDMMTYVYSELSKGYTGRDYYIYAISPLAQTGTNPGIKFIFGDVASTDFRLEGSVYKKEALY